MQQESAPLANYDKKTMALQSRSAAYSQITAAVGTFQSALTKLNTPATFQGLGATASNKDVLSGTAGAGAV
ncbi:hypothetical protein FPK47_21045, partial [Acinetobacter baumannii]|nr:hypothetical protein [Acinetobacter baumannii]